MKSLAIILVLLSVAGCVSNMTVLYKSEPYGARLIDNGNIVGTCPEKVTYKVRSEDRERGYLLINPVVAKWPSGASSVSTLEKIIIKNGSEQTHTIFRQNDDQDGYRYDQEMGARLLESYRAQATQLLQLMNQQQFQRQQQRQQQTNQSQPKSGTGTVTDIESGKTYNYRYNTN